jgi:hypothetical protein
MAEIDDRAARLARLAILARGPGKRHGGGAGQGRPSSTGWPLRQESPRVGQPQLVGRRTIVARLEVRAGTRGAT